MPNPDDVKAVPLADFITALRAELRAAQRDADSDLPIEVGPVTVEFTVLTRKEGEGRAGIRFWIVDTGVTGKLATESTQKVTMQLSPLGPTGERARVRDLEQGAKAQRPNPERRRDVEGN